MPWYIILNAKGLILAVYGAALEKEARASAKKIATDTGVPVTLKYAWFKTRPQVGSTENVGRMHGAQLSTAQEIVRP